MTNSNKSVKRINVGEHETCIFGIGLSYGILSKLSEMQLEEPIIRSIEFCKNLSEKIVNSIQSCVEFELQTFVYAMEELYMFLLKKDMLYINKKTGEEEDMSERIQFSLKEAIQHMSTVL